MLKTLKHLFTTRSATVSYPYDPVSLPEDVRGRPQHDREQCIACAACAAACPPNAISMDICDAPEGDGKAITWSINFGRCIFCGRCEEVCPTRAIRLSSEFELAVMSKDDLIESCTYSLQECRICGKPYAPRKEVDYVKQVIEGIAGKQAYGDVIDVCPACLRKRDARCAQAPWKGER